MFQPLAFGCEVWRFDGSSVGVVSVLENSHVNADALLGLRRWRVRRFNAEDGVPLPGRFLLDCDGLNISVVGQVTVGGERDFTEFREPQPGPTTRVFELEAGLTVGETAVLAGCLPVERPNVVAVLLAATECREVVVQPLNDFLENLRVNVFQVGPPLLEVGKPFLLGVCRGIVVSIESA